jgi:glycosyltransferase involved in cell wall biosynthesis
VADSVLSVLIASERVATDLPRCLRSLAAQQDGPPLEVVIAGSSAPEATAGLLLETRFVAVADRNPAIRRNRAAGEARGRFFAFLDDDAAAEAGWAAAGVRALDDSAIVGGPDLGPEGAPYAERLSDLLLATPFIGSGVPAHERNPRGGPVGSPHDVALCNLFVRREAFERLGGFDESLGYIGEDTDFVARALGSGMRVVLDPAVRVRHRRRAFPGPYLAQRWRYRVKTGRLLFERPGVYAPGRIAAFLGAGFLASAGAALFGLPFLLPAAALYAAAAWGFSAPIWRRDLPLFPAVPIAFAFHHATYFAGLLAGMASAALARGLRGSAGRSRPAGESAGQ